VYARESAHEPVYLADARTGAVRQPAGAVAACAGNGLVLGTGVVCLDTTGAYLDLFRATGRLPLHVGALGGEAVSPVTVDLGRRKHRRFLESRLVEFVAAPGAVVVYSREHVADGVPNRIVGLRPGG
jgi:hypothetical protein